MRYDMQLAETTALATLYDDDWTSNPTPTQCVISNYRSLDTKREASHLFRGVFPPGTPVMAAQVLQHSIYGWFVVSMVESLSPFSLRPIPVKVQLIPLPYELSGIRVPLASRGMVLLDAYDAPTEDAQGLPVVPKQTLSLRAQLNNQFEALAVTEEGPLPVKGVTTAVVPLGADVQLGDQIVLPAPDGRMVWVNQKNAVEAMGQMYAYQLLLDDTAGEGYTSNG